MTFARHRLMPAHHLIGLVPIGLMLAGCSLLPVEKPATQDLPTERPAAPAEPHPHAAEIGRLLAEARVAISEDRLTTPVEDNAYFRYLRVLTLDPDNETARFGLTDIVERYLDWVLVAIARKDFRRAARYLHIASDIDGEHPNIAAARRQIADAERTRSVEHRIDRDALEAKAAALTTELRNIGVAISDLDAKVTIRAPSDAAGRWIYQQLNHGGDRRIRAELEIGLPPSVEVFLPDTKGP